MDWGFIFIEGLLIVLFVALIIEASIAHTDVNKNKKDESADDKQYYDTARYYLGWCIGIGWTIFALGIILFIVNLFFTPEEAGALEEKQAMNKLKNVEKKAVKKLEKDEHDGLFGFKNITDGFFKKAIYFLTLGGLFAFGVLSAIAATAIGRTSTKKGYSHAIWATVLGILPFSLMVIWFIANQIYVSRKKEKIEQAEKREAMKKELVDKQYRKVKRAESREEKSSKTKPHSSPTKKSSSPTKSRIHSTISSGIDQIQSVVSSLSPESKKKLEESIFP